MAVPKKNTHLIKIGRSVVIWTAIALQAIWEPIGRYFFSTSTHPQSFCLTRSAFAQDLESFTGFVNRHFAKSKISTTELTLSDEQKASIASKLGSQEQLLHSSYALIVGTQADSVSGYILEDIVHGKWGPIHYAVLFDASGSIQEISILDFYEKRGAPIAKPRFLNQFLGKNANNPPHLNKNIKGITGASISSRGITDGVCKLSYVLQEYLSRS